MLDAGGATAVPFFRLRHLALSPERHSGHGFSATGILADLVSAHQISVTNQYLEIFTWRPAGDGPFERFILLFGKDPMPYSARSPHLGDNARVR
jgi:hypothetical protein